MSRLNNLCAIAQQYPLDPNTSAQEDFDELVAKPDAIPLYALVSISGEHYYITPFISLEAATEHAAANLDDEMYAETPLVLVQLDTLMARTAAFTIQWSAAKKLEAEDELSADS